MPAIDLSTMVYGKVPPQAKDLEEAVLGAIMLEKHTFDKVAEILTAECFYVDANQRVFRAFENLNNNSLPIDILTVVEALKSMDELDMVGGPYYVTKLTNAVVSTANVEAHSFIVKQKFLQRELIRLSGEIIGEAYEDSTDVFDLFDKVETALLKITSGHLKTSFHSMASLGVKSLEQMDLLMQNREEITGVHTGYPAVDRLTCGWQATDLIILAARPSVGKTALALNLAKNAAMHPRKPVPVGFFSLEMSATQLNGRLQSSESLIPLEKILRGRLNGEEYKIYAETIARLESAPIFIDDSAALNLYEFRSKARRMVSAHNVGLIILDYLQLMSGSGDKNGNREQEISAISRGLKQLAKELNVPIIALSQMSRAIEGRKGDPMLSDLRESGAIEQDADVVMFAMREDYQQDNPDPMIQGNAALKFAKHRNGELEKIYFKTHLSTQRWLDPHSSNNYFGSVPVRMPVQTTERAYSGKDAAAGDIEIDKDYPF